MKIQEIIDKIKKGEDEYFSYEHFCLDNMSDYNTMKWTIEDMMSVYNITEVEAAEIVQVLTH